MKLINKLLPSSRLREDPVQHKGTERYQPTRLHNVKLIPPVKNRILAYRKKADCEFKLESGKKLSVIVPYRDRKEHLIKFVPAISKVLQDQSIDFEIIIVEQYNDKPFNIGSLRNIGCLHADGDYFAIHDVDFLPKGIDYRCPSHPLRLLTHTYDEEGSKIDTWGEDYFSGVMLITKEQMTLVNGYSNLYMGWGFEDDDFLFRFLNVGLVPFFDTEGKFICLPHISNNPHLSGVDDKIAKSRLQANKERYSRVKRDIDSSDCDGLRQLVYQIIDDTAENIDGLPYRLIKVDF
ncbi:galactosyltransferase-related protein [Vibrio nomapromontoriensis]|uniref:galactosyltransferase-related protein n=1 Tax=Vibrio nomapromontoriensis TaxID=2910246 RepID=UPI003D0BFB76